MLVFLARELNAYSFFCTDESDALFLFHDTRIYPRSPLPTRIVARRAHSTKEPTTKASYVKGITGANALHPGQRVNASSSNVSSISQTPKSSGYDLPISPLRITSIRHLRIRS